MIKAIVFDFDGVLVNTYENHYKTYNKKFKNMNRDLHKKLFEGNVLELRKSLEIKDESLDISSELRINLLSQNIDLIILKILKKLKEKYLLFIITSHKEVILKEFFTKQNCIDLFEHIYGAETHTQKDYKFNLLENNYNLKPEEIIFVTDTLGDILEANKVKVKTIALTSGYHERERLAVGYPYKLIDNLSELENILNNI